MTWHRLRVIDGVEGATEQPDEGGGALKVALATNDMTRVDAHFAGAAAFAIHEVTAESRSLVEVIRFTDATAEDGQHTDNADRIMPRVEALGGCALLFVKAIGGPAAAKVVNARVHPLKAGEDEPIAEVLDRVQSMLRDNPPPWLRRLVRDPAPTDTVPADWDDDETEPADVPSAAGEGRP